MYLIIYFFLEFIESSSYVLSYIRNLKQALALIRQISGLYITVMYIEKAWPGVPSPTERPMENWEPIYLLWPIKDS